MHQTFSNPTVVEVLSELHFNLEVGRIWNDAWLLEMFSNIQNDYDIQMQTTPQKRVIYRHKEKPHFLQLSPGILSVNQLNQYESWIAFKELVREALLLLKKVIGPKSLHRIGLRYINAIPRNEEELLVSNWLQPSDYYPPAILRQQHDFYARYEEVVDGLRLIVTVAEQRVPIIFDIDCISEKEEPVDWQVIEKRLDAIHEHVWGVFASVLSPTLLKHLNK